MVNAVANKLSDEDSNVQHGAVDVICKLIEYDGACSKYLTQEIVTGFVNGLGDSNLDVRRRAIGVIGKLTEYDDIYSRYVTQEMVTAIVNKLGDGDSDVRKQAANVIGKLIQYENFYIQRSFLGILGILEKLDLPSMLLLPSRCSQHKMISVSGAPSLKQFPPLLA
ncbi:hypothetical protein CPB86DRAFT_178389 [Serendipita vermifera]|nr:hypothetical protein CPB86DRAFT_178389 [Serendipita vermifera]